MEIEKIVRDLIYYILIITCAIAICVPLFPTEMNLTMDDGLVHINRLIGTYESVKEGNFLALITSRFCNGFGHSWNIFYGPLTAFVPLVFKIFAPSFTMCLKLFIALTVIASGILMFKFVSNTTKNTNIGFVAAIIYITAPYRLIDIYHRVAIAEITSFVFIPLVFWGLYNIFNNNGKRGYYLAIGAIGLILTHNITTYYTVLFCVIYVLTEFKKLIDLKVLKSLFINLTFIILITSFFWIPMIEHYRGAKYKVFEENAMSSIDSMERAADTFLYLDDKFDIGPAEKETMKIILFKLGIPTMILLGFSILVAREISKEHRKIFWVFMIFGMLSLLMTYSFFPWRYLPKIFWMIQFPWRMLTFSTFFLSVSVAIGIRTLLKKEFIFVNIFIFIFCTVWAVALILTNYETGKKINEEDYYNGGIVVEDQRINPGCAKFEYLPIKAAENINYIATRKDEIYVLEGEVKLYEYKKNGSKLKARIETVSNSTVIELPYIYYLGYSVKLDKKEINTFESENGFLAIRIDERAKGELTVKYSGTTLSKVGVVVSVISLILFILVICVEVLYGEEDRQD